MSYITSATDFKSRSKRHVSVTLRRMKHYPNQQGREQSKSERQQWGCRAEGNSLKCTIHMPRHTCVHLKHFRVQNFNSLICVCKYTQREGTFFLFFKKKKKSLVLKPIELFKEMGKLCSEICSWFSEAMKYNSSPPPAPQFKVFA